MKPFSSSPAASGSQRLKIKRDAEEKSKPRGLHKPELNLAIPAKIAACIYNPIQADKLEADLQGNASPMTNGMYIDSTAVY